MEQREVTLADILACLREQKVEIKEAKEDTNNHLEKFMNAIENNIREIRKDVSVLNSIMEERDRDYRELHKNTEEKIETAEKRRREDREDVNRRMKKLEEALLDSKIDNNKEKEDIDARREKNALQSKDDPSDKTRQDIIEDRDAPKDKNKDEDENRGIESDWYKNVREELKEASEKADRMNKEKEYFK